MKISLIDKYPHTYEYLKTKLALDDNVTNLLIDRELLFSSELGELVIDVDGKEFDRIPLTTFSDDKIPNSDSIPLDLITIDATEHFIKKYHPQKIKEIKTLKTWLRVMIESNPTSNINIRTHRLVNEIFNDTLYNAIVFDNAGGLLFDVWEFDTREEVGDMLNSYILRDDITYGYILDGDQTLSEYQMNYPHWSIDKSKI